MHRLQRMLITCSGAVEEVLERKECRADAKRYAMIGAFVLLTAVFAFFSSAFALYTGTGSLALAIVLGLAWALMIFTLDRFVVSGIRKSDVEALPPREQHVRRLVEFLIACPRILLAALISIVVATPLELRIFQREIEAQLQQNQTLARRTAGDDLDREFRQAAQLRQENEALTRSTEAVWREHAMASRLASEELAGRALTGLRGDGPVYRGLKEQAEDFRRLALASEQKNAATIAVNNRRIAQLEAERERRLVRAESTIDKSDGFLARYSALGQMAQADGDVQLARTFLMLLFLALELTPVIMKLLLRRGPYDDYMETLEHSVHVTELTARSHMNDDAHAEVALHSRKNAERVRLEQTLTTETFDLDTVKEVAARELGAAQEKLVRALIQEWHRKQMISFGPAKPSRMPIRKPPSETKATMPPGTDGDGHGATAGADPH